MASHIAAGLALVFILMVRPAFAQTDITVTVLNGVHVTQTQTLPRIPANWQVVGVSGSQGMETVVLANAKTLKFVVWLVKDGVVQDSAYIQPPVRCYVYERFVCAVSVVGVVDQDNTARSEIWWQRADSVEDRK